MQMAKQLIENVRQIEGVVRAEIAGSVRRGLELVHNINIVVATTNSQLFRELFLQEYPLSQVIINESEELQLLYEGFPIHLKIVDPDYFIANFIYLTGSKEHNQNLAPSHFKRKYESEEDFYLSQGMSFIPPEIRENSGEIESAKQGDLPDLIHYKDIRGTFHVHTTESDGRDSLETMIQAADDLNWEYLGISDHSKSCKKGNGLNEERLQSQVQLLTQINESKKYKVHLFAGVECDILKDGTLDFEDSTLKELDFVVVSVHSHLDLDEASMTQRMIRAAENPYVTIFGHLSGRLLLRQNPYAFNVEKVIDACIANGKIIEFNSNPKRLDMEWKLWRKAVEKGLLCSIDPDAHDAKSLHYVKMGVKFMRKAWLEKKHVFNTLPLLKVKEHLIRR